MSLASALAVVDTGALRHRLYITSMMKVHGFVHFPFEFWHFIQGDALEHTPCADPLRPLNPMKVIEKEITTAKRGAWESSAA